MRAGGRVAKILVGSLKKEFVKYMSAILKFHIVRIVVVMSVAPLLFSCATKVPRFVELMPAPDVYSDKGITPFTDTTNIAVLRPIPGNPKIQTKNIMPTNEGTCFVWALPISNWEKAILPGRKLGVFRSPRIEPANFH